MRQWRSFLSRRHPQQQQGQRLGLGLGLGLGHPPRRLWGLLMFLLVLATVLSFPSNIEWHHRFFSPQGVRLTGTISKPSYKDVPTKRNHQHFYSGEENQAATPTPEIRQARGENGSSRKSRHHELSEGPYHNWELFEADYLEMLHNLKIFVYPDVLKNLSSPFANVFVPIANPSDPKLGNYYSEHAFKAALLRSSFITKRPEKAHFFFMPFSVNAMRNDPRLHSEASISDFIARYAARIGSEFGFWNASRGVDHFYVCCHSVGREAASKHHDLHNNAIQVTCSSSYFQRFYLAHKDVALPQIWPRPDELVLNPPPARDKLVFFAGRKQNSRVRQELLALWAKDTSMDIYSGNLPFSYQEGFRRSRFCLHVKGYEVNTARVVDAIHYGCIPIIISNYHDLPFANVLDWSKFSVIIRQEEISFLKKILSSITKQTYLAMYHNLNIVRRHFRWHRQPKSYDSFYMTAYQLWTRRGEAHTTSFFTSS